MDEARNARCECQTGHLSLSAAATGGNRENATANRKSPYFRFLPFSLIAVNPFSGLMLELLEVLAAGNIVLNQRVGP